MIKIGEIIEFFDAVTRSPETSLEKYLWQNRKIIGCFPYHAPEEIVHAAGMVPFGIWGQDGGEVKAAKQYFAPFYCSICQLGLEMGLSGKLDWLSGIIMPTLCDSLRPLSQNFRAAVPHIPFVFLAHPQNRNTKEGIEYTRSIYNGIKKQLEEISGVEISNERLNDSIKIYNKSRAERRRFIELAGLHADVVAPQARSSVLKSAFFMDKAEHTEMLSELNSELEKLPPVRWNGIKVVTTGIIADSRSLLSIFEENSMAVVADDVAHESRAIRADVPYNDDPITALALQFAGMSCDTLLFDPGKPRIFDIIKKVKEYDAHGVVVLMMQFCDPEEFDYPILKEELEKNNIPHIMISVDQQMRDYAQARTALQTFSELLSLRKV
jgi:bcr-type benzoyl-CoA reductase subunit C